MSETVTVTLSEFLLARIAEDEDIWRAVEANDRVVYLGGKRLVPKMLAECEAKRDVVDFCQALIDDADRDSTYEGTTAAANMAEDILERLALPYADHLDYRKEWA